MLKQLEFDVIFHNNRRLAGNHQFQTGTTAITGANERGKSMRLEMIRYALFGSRALRGKLDLYHKIDVRLSFVVGDVDYEIHRDLKKTDRIIKDGEVLATGTKPVNDAIECQILGYGLEVFDVANACLQGKVEELSDKTPAERKRMVDSTIGLDAVDKVIRSVSDDLNATRRVIEELKSNMVQVDEQPAPPKDYEKSGVLQKKLDEVEADFEEFIKVEAALGSFTMKEPSAPEQTITETVEYLEDLVQKYDNYVELKNKLNTIPEAEYTEEELGDVRVQHADLALWNEYPKPMYDKNTLQSWMISEDERSRRNIWNDYQKRIDTLEENKIECPECGAEHALEYSEVEKLKQEQFEYDYDEALILKEQPILIGDALDKEVAKWQKYDDRPAGVPEEKPEPIMSLDMVEHHQKILDQQEERKEIEQKLSKITVTEDPRDKLYKKKQEVEHFNRYNELLKEYKEQQRRKAALEKRYSELAGIRDRRDRYKKRLEEARQYEVDNKRWNELVKQQEQQQERITELEAEKEQYSKAREALKLLKPRVKTYLVPSLNKVASSLLQQMTNGQRQAIKVDEEFEIMVDGTPIDTLSGSGKAVANLSLRIGLGTVLTNKVFSVFLGDEIDASMDNDRAKYTAECMKNLTQVIDQVILVSHKDIEADHRIEL